MQGPGKIAISRFNSFEESSRIWRDFEGIALLYGTQTFSWLNHWYDKVGRAQPIEPCVVHVSDEGGRPLLLLPLGIEKTAGISRLTWLGGDITDYHAPLLGQEFRRRAPHAEEFRELWHEITKVLPPHDVIHFEKQPELIEQHPNPFLSLPHQVAYDTNYSSRLVPDWETFYQRRLKAELRSDSRRKRRALAKRGILRFAVADTPAEVEAVSRKMIEQKTERYLETRTYSLFNNRRYRAFFLEPPGDLLERGLLHVSALRLGEEIIATHWGLVYRGRLYYIMATFATGPWKRYSPGRLLLEDLFRWCFEHGIEVFDFTIGDEEFKRPWSNEARRLYRYLQPLNGRGAVYVKLEQAKNAVRRRPTLHRLINRVRNLKSRKITDR